MTNLNTYSIEDLQAEIKRRETRTKKPALKSFIDWTPVTRTAVDYMETLGTNKERPDDAEHWFYESVLEALYGKEVWKYINSISR